MKLVQRFEFRRYVFAIALLSSFEQRPFNLTYFNSIHPTMLWPSLVQIRPVVLEKMSTWKVTDNNGPPTPTDNGEMLIRKALLISDELKHGVKAACWMSGVILLTQLKSLREKVESESARAETERQTDKDIQRKRERERERAGNRN